MEALVVLENVSSQQMMAGALLVCPLCGGQLHPLYLRAGPAAFVAAATCLTCRSLVRARDAFSIEPAPG